MPALVYPVPLFRGRKATVSSGFREPNRPSHAGSDIMFRRHKGDGGPPGEQMLPSYARNYYLPDNRIPAVAMADGRVVVATGTNTGDYVKIEHPQLGMTSEYMHMRRLSVKAGQAVLAGTPLGAISYNPIDYKLAHLHFQLRKNGVLVDPEPFIRGLPAIKSPWEIKVWLNLTAAAIVGYIAYEKFRGKL